jgi:predicted O-methyltransferase YrrM
MSTELISPQVSEYLDSLVPPRELEMQEMEAIAVRTNFPIIGPASGYLCYLVTRILGAKRVFEMGSGYGYSTAWFAKAVQENGGGEVFHVVWDANLSQRAHRHLSALGFEGTVTYRIGEAVQTLRESDGLYDVIFNDIDKEGYPASLAVIEQKLRPGGALIIDNMLWHGRIFDSADKLPATEGVREFTRRITRDPKWAAGLLPVRDGLIVALRK